MFYYLPSGMGVKPLENALQQYESGIPKATKRAYAQRWSRWILSGFHGGRPHNQRYQDVDAAMHTMLMAAFMDKLWQWLYFLECDSGQFLWPLDPDIANAKIITCCKYVTEYADLVIRGMQNV